MADTRGAAFCGHSRNSIHSFAAAALEKLDGFLAGAEGGTLYVFESHPLQSTVRVLLQLDAPEAENSEVLVGAAVAPRFGHPRWIYLRESDPRRALTDAIRTRGGRTGRTTWSTPSIVSHG